MLFSPPDIARQLYDKQFTAKYDHASRSRVVRARLAQHHRRRNVAALNLYFLREIVANT
jgi:hypothetical protein